MQQRMIAHKLWIASILTSPYTKTTEEFAPNYITFNNKQISRVNLIATVIETFASEDSSFATLTLDDGSATMRAKAFKEDIRIVQNVSIGDLVLVIGKIREYNNEIYLIPEIVKKITNPLWSKVRKMELLKEIGNPPSYQPPVFVQETKPVETQNAQVMETVPASALSDTSAHILASLEHSETGVSTDDLVASLNLTREEVDLAISELMRNNEIYQNKPGHYKIL